MEALAQGWTLIVVAAVVFYLIAVLTGGGR